MQKAVLKVYLIDNVKKPLIEADIIENVDEFMEDFKKQLNSDANTVSFEQIGFERRLFHHWELEYKNK